jgi:Right handed beta helix region/Secretion system C-terminal sorting domain
MKILAMRNILGKTKTLIAFLLLVFSTRGFGTTYYVSSTGDDSNPGTSIAAGWSTISKVNSSTFLPGDTLYFEGGQTFNGNIFLPATDANDPNNLFVISTYGTGRATIDAGSSYGFYALNTQGFSISNLIFDGNSVTTNNSAGLIIFSNLSGNVKFNNISVSNVEIKNFGAEGVKIYTSVSLTGFQNLSLSNLSVHDVTNNGITISGNITQSLVGWQHKNVTISNCEVYNVPGSLIPAAQEGNGIVIAGVDGGVIQHCVAHDNGQNNVFCGGPVGIWSLESNNVTIEYCESYRNHSGSGCDGGGFDLDGGVTNSIMQYNYSHENDGAGYLMGQYENARPWANNSMRYNISQNDGVTNEGGIGLFKGPGTTMSGANIYNNTIYISPQAANTNESATYFSNWVTGINNVAFYNNIFYTTGGLSLVSIPAGYSAFFGGNIYWSSGTPFSILYQGNNYSSLDSWRTATGNEIVNGINTGLNSDPLLTNPGSGGTIGFGNSLTSLNAYQISSSTSPASNSALDLFSLFAINPGNTDFWGTILPGGTADGIGANQISIALPLVLLYFNGSCSGSGQNISWATGEETNMKSIELMRSGDGTTFSRLTDITPKGSNSMYNYINDLASTGNNYYKLKMTDLDGSISYSAVLNINCENISNKVSIGPNPFTNSFNVSIETTSPGPATIALYDAMGKMLSQRNIPLLAGNNQVNYDGMNWLPSGIYYLRIVNQDKAEHFKMLKAGN